VTTTLEDVLQRIKAVHAARVNDVKKHTEGVRAAVARYEKAAEEDCLTEFLVANGLATPTGAPKADDAALDLLHAVENLPELRTGGTVIELPEVPEDNDNFEAAAPHADTLEPPPPDAYAGLKRVGKPLMLFGGFAIPEKIRAMEKRTGLTFEWISNERNGSGDAECANACRQLRNGRFVAVIILNELISHPQSEHLVRAAKFSGTLHAIGKKAGTGALTAALDLFERQLKALAA
jgi:hypothetical protein